MEVSKNVWTELKTLIFQMSKISGLLCNIIFARLQAETICLPQHIGTDLVNKKYLHNISTKDTLYDKGFCHFKSFMITIFE